MKSKRTENLAEWRKANFKEIQKCLEVARAIRDDTEASNKDRIEAIKSIARMLAALAPERMSATKNIKGDESKELTQDEANLMDGLINDINNSC